MMNIMKRKYNTVLLLYNKKFLLSPEEIGLRAYFNIQYDRYSELMKKHKYIYHVILIDTLKVSNFKNYFELQRYAYRDYFSKNKKIRRKECVFHTILEVRQGENLFQISQCIN